MRKKLLFAIPALLSMIVIVLLIAPKIIALNLLSANSQQQLQQMTGQPELSLAFSNGWFQQSAQLHIDNPVMAGVKYEGQQIHAQMQITHGPLMLTPSGPRWGLAHIELIPLSNHSDVNALIESFGVDEHAPLIILVKMNGAMQLSLPQRVVNFSSLEELSASAKLSATLDLSRGGAALLEATMLDLRIEAADEQLRLDQFSLVFQTERLDRAAIPGKVGIEMRNLRVNAQETLTIDRISLDYSALEERELGTYSIAQQIHLENLVSGITIEDLKWSLIINDIDPELADNYIQLIRTSASIEPAQIDALMAQNLLEFIESARLLLAQKPISLSSNLSLDAFEGQHEANLTVTWPGLPNITSVDVMPFAQIVTGIDANLRVNADADSLQKTPWAATVNSYISQGLLIPDQGKIEINASLSDGTLRFNELEFPLTPFLDL